MNLSAITPLALEQFGQDVWWLILIKTVLIFVILVLLTLFNIWAERRVVARMQHRIGPNVHGPFGLLQSLADGVKLALKEDIIPKAADKVVFLLAPVDGHRAGVRDVRGDPVRARGRRAVHRYTTPLQLTDMPVAVLFVMAIASVGIYGIVLGGWASRVDVLAAGRAALQCADDLLRGGDGPRARRGLPVRRVTVDLRDRGRPGRPLVRPDPAAVVRHLRDLDDRRDQPRALRPPRGRGRAGRRLPHRVQLAEVRAVLPGRVHQHGHGLRAGDHAVPRWLARAVLDRPPLRRVQRGLLAGAVVLRQGLLLHLHLHLAARHRSRGCATTSSWRWAGSTSSRSRSAGSWRWRRSGRSRSTAACPASTSSPGSASWRSLCSPVLLHR